MEAKEELFQERLSHSDCSKSLLPVRDALDALNGKWKLQIIISLMFGNKRFTQIAKEIPNITDKMLSKELRDLEAHELVKRTVYDSIPVVVEYTLTEHGKSLRELIDVLRVWGIKHRNQVMGKAVLVES
ncbi:winged helix-turn-helix transcriptional regulator [Dyadobacter subterraneus]|uniref:Helix-turn-helix transcriptional regulator n=2 Tax=Dyadobacter subterraneus TaxID=2773304 RepID=A0ABR9W6A0_9BACT|nr:helix-turn-helix domain-containing protein [Dyadobacter subterraneus]MBE9460985.1 helix-turn-helix transcriptional regulator [Dyadobacter subterraneus]